MRRIPTRLDLWRKNSLVTVVVEIFKITLDMPQGLNNMETPTMVKSLNPNSFDQFNVRNRLALVTPQPVTNRQAYDIMYKSHQSYYDDKRIHVFDANFDKMENFLVHEFKSAIDKSIDFSGNANLVDVKDLDKRTLNVKNWDVAENAPYVHKDAIMPMKNNDDYRTNSKEMTTDPYGAIRGY